jgi:hypothetical protein
MFLDIYLHIFICFVCYRKPQKCAVKKISYSITVEKMICILFRIYMVIVLIFTTIVSVSIKTLILNWYAWLDEKAVDYVSNM